MTIALPPLPPARGFEGEEPGRAEILPRYEDITQDGRLVLTTMMPGLGAAVWRSLLEDLPAIDAFRDSGVLPILRRVVMVSEHEGPFSVHVPIAYEGRFRLAREKGGPRLFVNMWLDAFAPVAHSFGPPPPNDAPRVRVGRVFAEHVITKPFAKRPEDRKVVRLDVPGFPSVPEDEHVYEPGESLLTGTPPLAPAGDVVFGMMHTDSNQHVNSLVYPRVFEEVLVRAHRDPMRLARALDLRWRKPFFTGDRALVALALSDDNTHAVGTFSPENAPDRPSSVMAAQLQVQS